MMSVLPNALLRTLSDIAPYEHLPLPIAGLEGRPLPWTRVRVDVPLAQLIDRLGTSGRRCSPFSTGGEPLVLIRTPDGSRLEVKCGAVSAPGPIDVFVEAFDRALHTRTAGNSIAHWQAANDSIASLLGVVLAADDTVPSPALLPTVRARLPKTLREELKELRSGLDLRDSLRDLRGTLRFARGIAEHLGSEGGARLADEVRSLQTALESARFWNLRDVARWWAPDVRSGVLLRGRAPPSYAEEGFWDLPPEELPAHFVDLRDPGERAEEPYPPGSFAIDCLPFGLDSRGGAGLDGMYDGLPSRSGPALASILRAVAAGDGPVLVHCRAGVDRTGVVVAMLGTWLGIPRERIVADYLASGQLVEERRLLRALELAERIGIGRLISETGVSDEVLQAARRRLLA